MKKKKRKRKKKGQKTSFFTLKPNFVEGGHPQSLETKRFILKFGWNPRQPISDT